MSPATDLLRAKCEPGDVIANKFRVDRLLGSGGTGYVVLATHLQLDERVALKFLHDNANAETLVQEAKACLRLKTEHIARVKDIGRHNDQPFIVMEYLDGKDLHTVLEASGKLEDPGEAVELVVQICEAVAEAHRAGIVHRDIKLANIYFVASRTTVPVVKLLDFGIATSVAPTQAKMGTLHYMAPESLLGVDGDPRSDLWSIGVVLFELLTGWKPFDAKDVVSLVADICHEPHIPISDFREDIPADLVAVIDRCLEKDPEARFQTAGELAAALQPFAPARALVNIERALAWAEGSAPSSVSSITSLGTSTSRLRSSGSLRSSGARTVRETGARSGTTLPAPAASKLPLVKIGAWALSAVAVVALVFVLTSRQNRTPEAPAAAAVTAAPTTAAVAPTTTPSPAATPAPTPAAETAQPSASARPPAKPAAFVGGPLPKRTTPTASPASNTGTTATASGTPAAATGTSKGLEADPWHSNKPKLDDSPFR